MKKSRIVIVQSCRENSGTSINLPSRPLGKNLFDRFMSLPMGIHCCNKKVRYLLMTTKD